MPVTCFDSELLLDQLNNLKVVFTLLIGGIILIFVNK